MLKTGLMMCAFEFFSGVGMSELDFSRLQRVSEMQFSDFCKRGLGGVPGKQKEKKTLMNREKVEGFCQKVISLVKQLNG